MALRLFSSKLVVGCRFGVVGGVAVNRAFSYNLGKFSQTRFQIASINTSSNEQIKKPDYGDVQALIERDHFVRLRKKIENDDRKKISIQEFQSLCEEEGLSKEQAERLVQSLNDSGVVLHFPNSANKKLQQTVFLRPNELNATVHSLLDHTTPASLQLQADATQAEIDALNAQLAPLLQHREQLERKSNTRANIVIFSGLGYCVLQFLAIGRLTWWELSWDVMEPVTYMLTFATALIGYGYFVLTGSEYSYEGLKRNISERRFKALVKKTGFDETQFKRLQRALNVKEESLHKILDDIYHSTVISSMKKSKHPVLPPFPVGASTTAGYTTPQTTTV